MDTNQFSKEIVIVDKDPVIRGNIQKILVERLGNKYVKFVETGSHNRYQEVLRDPQTSLVIFDFDVDWFDNLDSKKTALVELKKRNIPVILTLNNRVEFGLVSGFAKDISLEDCLVKPGPLKRNALGAPFYHAMGERVERNLRSLPSVMDTVAIVGVGKVGRLSAILTARHLDRFVRNGGAYRIILYNHGMNDSHVQDQIQDILRETKIMTPEGRNLEVLVADELAALRYNTSTYILSYGDREWELAKEGDIGKTPLDFFEHYFKDTKEIYQSILPYSTVVQVTNPPEPLAMIGRLFVNGTGIQKSEGERERIEAFAFNDYQRCYRKLEEWGNELVSKILKTGVAVPDLKLFGRHHGHTGILRAEVNQQPVDRIGEYLGRPNEINAEKLLETLDENKKVILKANGSADAETASSLVRVLESIVYGQESYAGINIQPWEYRAFTGGSITIGENKMSLTDYWRRYFPDGVVMSVPVKRTLQRYRFPDRQALGSEVAIESKIRVAEDCFKVRKRVVAFARKHVKDDPDQIRVLNHFGEAA